MSEMKMSDVFALPMTQGITCVMSKDHRHEIVFDESDSNVSDQIEHVAHAINNHDRMVEEIAELKDKVDELRKDKFQLIDAAEYLHEKLIKEGKRYGASINRKMISKLLAKLNQEGEE